MGTGLLVHTSECQQAKLSTSAHFSTSAVFFHIRTTLFCSQRYCCNLSKHGHQASKRFKSLSARAGTYQQGADIVSSGRLHLSEQSRVLLVGPASQRILPALQMLFSVWQWPAIVANGLSQDAGIQNVLVLEQEPSSDFAQQLQAGPSKLGNHFSPRLWQGTLDALPAFQGPFDAVIWANDFGRSLSVRDHLLRASLITLPGGHVCALHLEKDEERKKQDLNARQLRQYMGDLPLRGVAFVEGSHLILQVPPGYALKDGPVVIAGDVTSGFGRGSRKLGTPTANLPPEPLREQLSKLPLGVYFGWACLEAEPGQPSEDSQVHEMVMNIGRNPTVQDEGKITVELHILHKYGQDFYGRPLKAVVLGFLRPEMKFAGLAELLAQIRRDTGVAQAQLKTEMHAKHRHHIAFSG